MIGKDGRTAPRISYAFPDARRAIIDLLLEVARKPIDGVSIFYNRRPPLVGYEPPLVESFITDHGEDPRQLHDDDPRWLRYRCTHSLTSTENSELRWTHSRKNWAGSGLWSPRAC